MSLYYISQEIPLVIPPNKNAPHRCTPSLHHPPKNKNSPRTPGIYYVEALNLVSKHCLILKLFQHIYKSAACTNPNLHQHVPTRPSTNISTPGNVRFAGECLKMNPPPPSIYTAWVTSVDARHVFIQCACSLPVNHTNSGFVCRSHSHQTTPVKLSCL